MKNLSMQEMVDEIMGGCFLMTGNVINDDSFCEVIGNRMSLRDIARGIPVEYAIWETLADFVIINLQDWFPVKEIDRKEVICCANNWLHEYWMDREVFPIYKIQNDWLEKREFVSRLEESFGDNHHFAMALLEIPSESDTLMEFVTDKNLDITDVIKFLIGQTMRNESEELCNTYLFDSKLSNVMKQWLDDVMEEIVSGIKELRGED